jgi:hypothetical protein
MASFADNITSRLADVGLAGATLVSSSPSAQSFGDGEAVFRLDGLLLRFVRDRGQAFLDIASSAAPTEFHQYDDIEIAMAGRRSIKFWLNACQKTLDSCWNDCVQTWMCWAMRFRLIESGLPGRVLSEPRANADEPSPIAFEGKSEPMQDSMKPA